MRIRTRPPSVDDDKSGIKFFGIFICEHIVFLIFSSVNLMMYKIYACIVYVYIYICMQTHVCIYIYIYIVVTAKEFSENKVLNIVDV